MEDEVRDLIVPTSKKNRKINFQEGTHLEKFFTRDYSSKDLVLKNSISLQFKMIKLMI